MNRWLTIGTLACAATLALTGCPTEDNNSTTDMGTNNGSDMSGADASSDMGEANLLYIAKIESTTMGDEGCAVEDPGPDIFGVGLEDGEGAPLAWGSIVWEQIQLGGNTHSDSSLIDGSALDFGGDACPDMFDGNVLSLGCEDTGNWIAVEFLDGDSNRVALDATAGQVIRVYEWGGQCTTGSLDDTYDLTICTDTAGITMGDDASCTVQLLVDGAGEQSGDVTGF